MTNRNWTPITKVVAAFVASGLTWLALQAGVDLGSQAIEEAASAAVGIAAAYLIPDRRVQSQ
jgi:hypothetical protein